MTTACWAWALKRCLLPHAGAAARWPRQCSAIRTCLDRLARYEAEGSEDLDAVSGCFGELMAELFDYRQDHWSPELRSIGFNLGKYIYLLDAYDDLARDERKGAYNPLRTLSREPGYEEEMREIFELLLANCARSFERLPVWRTLTFCATSCIRACGSNITAKMQKRRTKPPDPGGFP